MQIHPSPISSPPPQRFLGSRAFLGVRAASPVDAARISPEAEGARRGSRVSREAARVLDGPTPDGRYLLDVLDLLAADRRALWKDPVEGALNEVREGSSASRTRGLAGLTALEALGGAPGPGQGLKAWIRTTARRACQLFPSAGEDRACFLEFSLKAMERYSRECANPVAARHFEAALDHGATLWGRMKVERYERALVEAWKDLDLADRAFHTDPPPPGEVRREGPRIRIGLVDLPVRS